MSEGHSRTAAFTGPLLALLTSSAAALPSDKLSESSPWVQCDQVYVLEASGYPGLDRKYTLRGICRVKNRISHIDPSDDYDHQLAAFEVMGVVRYDGLNGETKESLKVAGVIAQTSGQCIVDPFIREPGKSYTRHDYAASCKNMKVADISNAWAQTALLHQPMFRLAVDPAMAEALSKLAPTPDPNPKQAVVPPPLKKTPKALKMADSEPVVAVPPVIPLSASEAGQQPASGGPASGKPAAHLHPISPTPSRRLAASRPAPTPTLTPAPRHRNR